ncbi:DUF72 domain-containing protein [Pandoraea nosoerga]|uniref:DUF72 domain-containing protein n=1 Tax=Pandoraea nosoerga TaxID=2508296 RepID=A0A5E4XBC7_9BURK|nr:DUF72 domain-containing protein [Pandoraea nosoerga]MBN4666085.1 DUF72 domain-containing protein [Pandoraea nosoerga]MBN4676672.1 DUF72 domain-containing protein [Pandoraea nosoerga]MBN4683212.1 DUF72 domain-containing protein [Pandoraea nosoerga]MBN4745221.1 DUF72 domain-containing protein [Pandoraea nosoerga]VVE33563.1 hypothetical protein PNO31109_03765 [Pandoraea nosoerga]
MSQFDLFGAPPDDPPAGKRARQIDGDASAPSAPSSASSPSPSGAGRHSGAVRRGGVGAADHPAATRTLGAQLPANIRLGTSSWSFPGWKGIVWDDDYSDTRLSREGLAAYASHPVLRCVGIDRSFYKPMSIVEYQKYAQQVPDDFRFLVKAPSAVTDALVRGDKGEGLGDNPCFLDARIATEQFVAPCLAGLGPKAGVLVFQISPLPADLLRDVPGLIQRIEAFFAALPPLPEGETTPDGVTLPGPCYALEIRDGALLTPRLMRTLGQLGVRYCIGLHARMPHVERQAAALAMLDEAGTGPLVVRWNLNSAHRYEQAKAKYAPFDKIVDPDPVTRDVLAALATHYALAGHPVYVIVNNKAEGSSPLSCQALAERIGELSRSAAAPSPEAG